MGLKQEKEEVWEAELHLPLTGSDRSYSFNSFTPQLKEWAALLIGGGFWRPVRLLSTWTSSEEGVWTSDLSDWARLFFCFFNRCVKLTLFYVVREDRRASRPTQNLKLKQQLSQNYVFDSITLTYTHLYQHILIRRAEYLLWSADKGRWRPGDENESLKKSQHIFSTSIVSLNREAPLFQLVLGVLGIRIVALYKKNNK